MENTPFEFQIMIFLKFLWLYQQVNYVRKQSFNNYLAITICQKYNNEDIKTAAYTFFNYLQRDFPIYNIYMKKINNLEMFNDLHRKVIKKGWKNLLLQMKEKDNEGINTLKEVSKKKIIKGSKLYISNYDKSIKENNYNLIWFNIQECLYKTIINYCKANQEIRFSLVFYLSYLQSLENDLDEAKKNKIVNEIINDCCKMANTNCIDWY